jgi:hypothetical protein
MKLAFAYRREGWLAILMAIFVVPALAADGIDRRARAAPGVLEHHGNALRAGMYVVPTLTFERARNLRRDPSFNAEISSSVYAQPLYWRIPGSDKRFC